MSGIASLFGGSSAKADRKAELDARDQLRNVFNYALPTGEATQASGSSLSNAGGDAFANMLRAGRTQTAQEAAPAINATISAADAQRRREAATGTGRTGGTAELNRQQDVTNEGQIGNIINQTQNQNRVAGAQGAAAVGSDQMRQAAQLLGLSGQQIDALLKNTADSRVDSQNIHNQTFNDVGGDVGNLLTYAFLS